MLKTMSNLVTVKWKKKLIKKLLNLLMPQLVRQIWKHSINSLSNLQSNKIKKNYISKLTSKINVSRLLKVLGFKSITKPRNDKRTLYK